MTKRKSRTPARAAKANKGATPHAAPARSPRARRRAPIDAPTAPPSADPEPLPPGRPRIELTPDQVRQVEVMAGLGLARDEIAAVLGVSPGTLKRRTHDTEAVADAFDRGRALVTRDVLEGLAARAKTGDPAAVKLYLTVMRREGFTDAGEGEGRGGPGVQINVLGGPTGMEVNVEQPLAGAVVQVAAPAADANPRTLGARTWAPRVGGVAAAAAALLRTLATEGGA